VNVEPPFGSLQFPVSYVENVLLIAEFEELWFHVSFAAFSALQ
jgi:hypothetical protein